MDAVPLREAAVERAARVEAEPAYGRSGLWAWLTTVDHKKIGIMYLLGGTFFFAVGGAEAFMMRLQLMNPHNRLFVGEVFNQLVTAHGTTMIFFAVMPLFIGFINCIVPLQIGARDVAFPYLNALSLWLFYVGGILFNIAWVAQFVTGRPSVPDNGWFNYAPLSISLYNPGPGIDFYDLGIQISGIGSFMTGINFIVTIVNMRAPGLSFRRLPLFTWAALVTMILILFAFPPLTVDLFLLMFDRMLGMHFFDVTAGGNVLIWQHLFWIFGHPEVYILVLPAFGIISEVVTAFSGKTLYGYDSMVLAICAIGFLSFMVWSHHMFAVGMGPVVNSIFSITTMLIAIPTGVKIFNWIMTMWGGKLRLTTAMLYAIGFIPIFVIGGMSGVMVAMAPADYQYNMSYFVVAHFHYVMIGGSLFALLAALYYWAPRIFARKLDERLGKVGFWLVFVGFNVTFFPQHFAGLLGMPRRIFTYRDVPSLVTMNELSTIGVFILALGFLTVLANLVKAALSARNAEADPWDGRSLEWTIPVPTPEYNFAQIPQVRSRDAWWREKRAGRTRMPAAEALQPIHMPPTSIEPLVLAVAVGVAAMGAIYSLPLLIGVGLLVAAVCLYRAMFREAPGYHVMPAEEPARAAEVG